MIMFSGKSAAKTFFARFFDKDQSNKEPLDDADDAAGLPRRKRSQSMFAHNVDSLLSGDHPGGVQPAGREEEEIQRRLLDMVGAETRLDPVQHPDGPDGIFKKLLDNCDRLNSRRATDFSQVGEQF